MTRVGLISDIHGNAFALDAVLAELERDGVDEIVCLGDVAVGPQPRETLARVRALGCPVIMGNWDAWFLDPPLPPADDEIALKLHDSARFWSQLVEGDDLDYMRTFLPAYELDLGAGEPAICFHGSPTSYDDFIYAATPDEDLLRMLGDERRATMIGGHSHVQLLRRLQHDLFVNPGSVGLPFADWWPNRVRIARDAEYGVIEHGGDGIRVELRSTPYDVAAHQRLLLDSGVPHAQWWVDSWLAPDERLSGS